MKPPADPNRSRAYTRGLSAEFLCVLILRLKGYRIVARRFRCPQGEIDIVARRGRLIAVIEVKARPTEHAALEAVSPRQQQRIIRAATVFLGRHPALAGHDCRFDLIWVGPGLRHKHIMDAWRG
jgi:putative endonuclease